MKDAEGFENTIENTIPLIRESLPDVEGNGSAVELYLMYENTAPNARDSAVS